MLPLTEKTLRASFINASVRERQTLSLPHDFDELAWRELDFLAWRDRRIPSLGYVVIELAGQPTGVLLRQAEAKTRSRPQCSWCEDVQLPNDVVFYSAKRAGAAGRQGNTIGTLACAEFQCPTNVRKRPALAYVGFDVEAERQRRIQSLNQRVGSFVRSVSAS